MHANNVDESSREIKPGESLSTPEWWAVTHEMTLEQRGFAYLVLSLMHRDGWTDIPDDRTLADGLRLHIRKVRRLRPILEAVPTHTIVEQIKRMQRWPALIIEELAP